MSDQGQVVGFVRNTATVVEQQQLGNATSQIQYLSQGHTLAIGNAANILSKVSDLKANGLTVVEINPEIGSMQKRLTDDGVAVFTVPKLNLTGYLGSYKAIVPAPDPTGVDFDLAVSVYLDSACFDLVLDTSPTPLMPVYLKPFGYKHVTTSDEIDEAISEFADMAGEFEKPKYFNYNESICAHSRSKLSGCTRCIDVCATGAIISRGDGVSVDPFLCQGCGSCATVCPSGAMSYAYPRPSNAIDRTRAKLSENPDARMVLLYSEADEDAVATVNLPVSVLSLQVEEVSAFGADYWLTMLAGQACRIALVSDARKDDPSVQAVQGQIDLVHELLSGLGVDETVVSFLSTQLLQSGFDDANSPLHEQNCQASKLNALKPADFATHNDKRQTMRLALDAISEQIAPLNDIAPLSKGAPFGKINVDVEACTLCMSCVSSCPAKALLDGQDTPALRFVEANCLQCGLCETACPEDAINLEAQFSWDSLAARQIKTLNEEEPFHCLSCHTPFTTRSMIESMGAKLAGHWMFEDPKALRRLKMCGDCRVKDMFEEDQKGIEVHKEV